MKSDSDHTLLASLQDAKQLLPSTGGIASLNPRLIAAIPPG